MKTLVILCNVVLFGFTCFVLAAEGLSRQAAYILFTLLLLLIPIFTVFVLVRKRTPGAATLHSSAIQRVAGICNVALLGFVCWAILDQYPHPEEPGVIPYAALAVLTPILSAIALFGIRMKPASQTLVRP